MTLKERIIKEMVMTNEEEDIQELIRMRMWDEDKIRKRWKELKGSISTKKVYGYEQGNLCPECKQIIGTNTMCSDCARFRASRIKRTMTKITITKADAEVIKANIKEKLKELECDTCGGCGEVPYLGSPIHGKCPDCDGSGGKHGK